MVLYVAFVAVTNICIGFAVARILHPRTNAYDGFEASDEDDTYDNYNGLCDVADPSDNAALEASSGDEELGGGRWSDNSQNASRDLHSWLGDKCEFAEQLREITERAKYSYSARDKNLLRQSAEQVLSCVTRRYDELQQIFSSADSSSLLVGDTLEAVEMLSAQMETSMSNLRTFDWSVAFDDAFVRIDSELTLLNEQQRKISKLL